MRYKAQQILHAVAGLILNLAFHMEDQYGVVYMVNIFLFPDLSLSEISQAALVAKRWYTALDIRKLTTYADTASLLHHQKVVPIVGWDAAKSML